MTTIRDALVANMHDGDEGGRLTMSTKDLLDETCEIIQEFVLDDEIKELVHAGKFAKALKIVADRLGGFPPDEDPSDVLRARDYDTWIAQPSCEAEHANLKTYLTYGCVRRGTHRAHQDVLGDEWGTGSR